MQDGELRHFMEHYVPRGMHELAQQQQQEAEARGGAAAGALALAGGGSSNASLVGGGSGLAAGRSLEDVLRMPATTHKGALHAEPSSRRSRGGNNGNSNKRRAGGDASVASTQELRGAPSAAGDASLSSKPSESHSVLAGSASVPQAGAELASHHSHSSMHRHHRHHHHLGTQVGVNAKRRRGRHMAFAGGVATAILDLTTHPSVGMPEGLSQRRLEALRRHLHDGDGDSGASLLGQERGWDGASPPPPEWEASQPLHPTLPPIAIPTLAIAPTHTGGHSPLHSARSVTSLRAAAPAAGMSHSLTQGGGALSPGRSRLQQQQQQQQQLPLPHLQEEHEAGAHHEAHLSSTALPTATSPAPGVMGRVGAGQFIPQHYLDPSSLVSTPEEGARRRPLDPDVAQDSADAEVATVMAQQGAVGAQPSLAGDAAASSPSLQHHRPQLFASPLPKLPNAPSPVLCSPALKQKVLLQPPNSSKASFSALASRRLLVDEGARDHDCYLTCLPIHAALAVCAQTAKYCQQRTAAIVSGFVRPDGTLDLSHGGPPAASASLPDLGSSTSALPHGPGAPTASTSAARVAATSHHNGGGLGAVGSAPALGPPGEPSVVILPHMMNVYQSVLSSSVPVMLGPRPDARRPSSTSPPRTHWGALASLAGHNKQAVRGLAVRWGRVLSMSGGRTKRVAAHFPTPSAGQPGGAFAVQPPERRPRPAAATRGGRGRRGARPFAARAERVAPRAGVARQAAAPEPGPAGDAEHRRKPALPVAAEQHARRGRAAARREGQRDPRHRGQPGARAVAPARLRQPRAAAHAPQALAPDAPGH